MVPYHIQHSIQRIRTISEEECLLVISLHKKEKACLCHAAIILSNSWYDFLFALWSFEVSAPAVDLLSYNYLPLDTITQYHELIIILIRVVRREILLFMILIIIWYEKASINTASHVRCMFLLSF